MPAAPPPRPVGDIPLDAILLAAVDDLGPAQLRAVQTALAGRAIDGLDAAVLEAAGVPATVAAQVRALLHDVAAQGAWRERIAAALGADGQLLGPAQMARWPGLDEVSVAPAYLACGPRLDEEALARRRLAIVGTREASPEALRWTRELARALARQDVVIVSGGARGIDTAAHQGAVDGGGSTLCVLGGAFDQERADRPEHLAWLWQHATVLSETFFSTPTRRWMYPRRNRLVAALAQAVLVVQGRQKSGARITADWARQLERPLLARPGAVNDARAALPNALLVEGARACLGEAEVLRALEAAEELARTRGATSAAQLELPAAPRRARPPAPDPGAPGASATDWIEQLPDPARRVCRILGEAPGGLLVDELAARAALAAPELASVLLALELDGRLRREPGPRVALVVR